MASKPSVLIIGGLGYIGRWLALYLYENKLASEVRIVDKQLPALAWLPPEMEDACKNFVQADMSREHSAEKVFNREDGSTWDYVFNCGGETRYSQEEEVYKQRTYQLAITAGKEAAKRGVKVFVELSDSRVYKSSSKPSKETDTPHPWLALAKYKLLAEEDLKRIPGLNLVILRLPNVYGRYSTKYVSTILCNARVYQEIDEPMKLLWTKDLRIHTLHIDDTVRSLWHAAEWYTNGKQGWDSSWGEIPLFNVVDEGDTSQGMIVDLIADIFKIETGFVGSTLSQFAKSDLPGVAEEANKEVLNLWAALLEKHGITRPGPINPFLEVELLQDADSAIDGSRFKNVTGFKINVPKLTKEIILENIETYKKMKWWPAGDGQ